jgi:hypothetical protein
MHIDKKKDLSIVKEMNLLKSIYITAKKILPYLENIYFYDDIERLDFTHLLPYINKELVEFFFDTDSAEYSEKKIFLHNGILIPLLEKSDGHVIDDIFEKNIFQSFQAAPIFFPQHILYTPGWFKEINALTLQRDHEVAFYFLNFLQDINTRIKIFYYPFLTDEDTVALVDEIDRKVFYNREICSEIIRIKKIAEEYNIPITIEVMPLKAILYFPSYSLYIQLIGKDRKNIQHVFELLFKK